MNQLGSVSFHSPFLNQFWIASMLVCSFCEAKVGSLALVCQVLILRILVWVGNDFWCAHILAVCTLSNMPGGLNFILHISHYKTGLHAEKLYDQKNYVVFRMIVLVEYFVWLIFATVVVKYIVWMFKWSDFLFECFSAIFCSSVLVKYFVWVDGVVVIGA
jgi:hypothetical protein